MDSTRERVSATILSWPEMWRISVENRAMMSSW
jgi:hypothetical protein